MDVIILCHTEFGRVYDKEIIFDKNSIQGVKKGVFNLIKIANSYGAKVTFATMPETVESFPNDTTPHEIGLHIHPGWVKWNSHKKFQWYVGDSYLNNHCTYKINSTVLQDYSYKNQLEIIKTGKEYVENKLEKKIKSFVSGRWSVNNETIKALIQLGITNECSAQAHSKSDHYDWSKLPRICMPYHPSENDYQKKGNLPILILPISQMLRIGNVNPEIAPISGLSWLKACFLEYYRQDLPLFHICLHSPSMTDKFFISTMEKLLKFISKHDNINFKCASEIKEYKNISPQTKLLPYIIATNRHITKTYLKGLLKRTAGVTK